MVLTLRKEPWALGINASHNGAVCLLHGDRIVAAIQEERLTRIKRQRIYGVDPGVRNFILSGARQNSRRLEERSVAMGN
jgi:carbamoyltransferase